MWYAAYHHTFACDEFNVGSREEAMEKAIESLRNNFPNGTYAGVNRETGETIRGPIEDLIEEIFWMDEEDFEEDEEEEYFEPGRPVLDQMALNP